MRSRAVDIVLLCSLLMSSMGVMAVNLYKDSEYSSLVSDHKAEEVGDLLTIIVLENSTASTHAGTQTSKDSSAGTNLKFGHWNFEGNISGNGNSDGQGKTVREGSVKAQFTVQITGVTTHGDLKVEGFQKIYFNKETQLINLKAVVRRADIQADNTVYSNRLGNLELSFTGDGKISETQQNSIFSYVFSLFGLL